MSVGEMGQWHSVVVDDGDALWYNIQGLFLQLCMFAHVLKDAPMSQIGMKLLLCGSQCQLVYVYFPFIRGET